MMLRDMRNKYVTDSEVEFYNEIITLTHNDSQEEVFEILNVEYANHKFSNASYPPVWYFLYGISALETDRIDIATMAFEYAVDYKIRLRNSVFYSSCVFLATCYLLTKEAQPSIDLLNKLLEHPYALVKKEEAVSFINETLKEKNREDLEVTLENYKVVFKEKSLC